MRGSVPDDPSASPRPAAWKRWRALEPLFDAALDLPPEERAVYLRDAVSEDPELQVAVEELLRGVTEGEDLTQPAAVAFPALVADLTTAHSRIGERIGPYRIVAEAGRGGMGEVFVADRADDQYTSRVALKLLRPGLHDSSFVRRFLDERQILASLVHPRIARLYDGGVTDDGRPWFAMEYVEGLPIDQFCDDGKLSIARRLVLFLQVCDTVAFAHSHGVIHRDLKPSNILVDDQGEVRLVDFGIAKVTTHAMVDAERSRAEQAIGTPQYSSPEQTRGDPVTAANDVYSLGVVLYRLLAGVHPHRVTIQAHATTRAKFGSELIPPSEAVAQQGNDRRGPQRATTLQRRLRGDLDAIVAKSLASEPTLRYPTVQHFADDLRRYTERRPILARKASPAYRIGRFIERNRISVAAGALVVASLVTATAVSVFEARQAERARDRAVAALDRSESVSSFLISLFQSSDPSGLPDDALTARAVLSRGLTRVDKLAGQPELQARLLDALGNVLVSLDDLEEGRALLERSLALRRNTLGDAHPEVLASLRNLERAYRNLGQFPRALAIAEETLRLQRQAGAPPDTLAVSLSDVAFMLPFLGRTRETVTLYREVVDLMRREHGGDDPRVAEALRRLGSAQRRIGLVVAAESSYRAALDINTRQLGPDDRATVFTQIFIADLAAFDYPAAGNAEQLYRDAIATLERVRGPHHIDLEHPLDNLAELMLARGEAREAERIWRRLLEIRLRHFGAEHRATIFSEQGVGRALYRQGRREEGEAMMRTSLERHIRLLGPEHPFVATAMQSIAEALGEGGQYRDAEELMRKVIIIRRRTFGERTMEVGWAESILAGLFIRHGEYSEARPLLENAISVQLERSTPAHRETRLTYKRLAGLYARMGDTAKQRQYAALAGDVR